MRTVSFVDYFELEFEGSVFSKAMLAADVDNDSVSIRSVLLNSSINCGHCLKHLTLWVLVICVCVPCV